MRTAVKQIELKVLKFIEDEKLILPSSPVVIGVSGGSDSVCLLHLLYGWAKARSWRLTIAYFHHGLRKQADQDEKFVAALAQTLNLPFQLGRGNSLQRAKESGDSIEEAARHLRYTFLKEVAQNVGDARIAIGHHLDDQLETFFVQLFKGAGLGGLSGMRTYQHPVIRPLLCLTKAEVLFYLKTQRLSFIEDESNHDQRFLRNQVRHDILPYLRNKIEPNFFKSITRLMAILKEEHEYLKMLADDQSRQVIQHQGGAVRMEVLAFRKLPRVLQRRIIKNVLDALGPKRNYASFHIEQNRKLFEGNKTHKILMLPEGILAKREKKYVIFSKNIDTDC